ncbi:hypothetical protein [Roseomonas sp. 18066]|uniref:GumC family protein n=1 Tax=Roseomonas sp. 18066 TaxID=2681412 RepID=UPI001356CE55|nr:hypothetical protein [Roseomonas sp. 18066]
MNAAALPPAREESFGLVATADPYGAPPVGGFHLSDVLITLRLRWMPLLAAFLVPAALGIGAGMMAGSRYVAESVLLVQVSRESTGAQDLTGFGQSVVSIEILKVSRSEMEILRSAEVLRAALRAAGPDRLFPGIPQVNGANLERGVVALGLALKTEPDTTSNILRVSLTMPSREAALRGLTAILDAYMARRAAIFTDESSRLLLSEVERYGTRIGTIEEQIRQARTRYGVLDIAQEIALTSTRRDDLLQRENRTREQQAMTQAQLAAAETALAAQPRRVYASSEATNLVPNDESRNSLTRLLQDRQHMAAQYAPDYPGLRDLDQRIEALRNAIREGARNTYSTTREMRNPNLELLSSRVVTLKLEQESLERQLGELARQRQEAETRGEALLGADRQLRDLTRERDGLEAISRQLTAREAGTRIDEEARRASRPGIQVVQPPAAPLEGRSLRLVMMAGGIALGLAAAGALGLLLALTRRVYATPEEAERGLRLPALAALGNLAPSLKDLRPVSGVEDLASLICDTRINGRRPQIVQLVATGPADGRDELGRALVLALARRSPADIALIDLQSDGRGHLSALGSQPLEVERVPGHVMVFSTVVENLWVSHQAMQSDLSNPRATREETATLLGRLRDAFALVVVIGPDQSDNYAMRRLSAMVDANVMVVRGERTRGDRARAVRDWVLASGGALLGFAYTGHRRILPAFVTRFL